MKHIFMATIIISIFGMQSISAEEHNHDDHAGHAHAEEGASTVLGDVILGTCTLEVSSHSELEVGKEFGMELIIEEGVAPEVLRVWIGVKNGRGSMKLLLVKGADGKSYHAHVAVPQTLAADSQIWFESVDTQGAKHKSSLPIGTAGGHSDHDHDKETEHNHKKDEHAGHKH